MSASEDGFFAELKRRNIIRVAVVYVVVSWLLLQVGDLLFEALGLPDWSIRLLFALLALGLPLVLIFSWAFEITPEGLKREKDIERSESITRITARKLDRLIIGALVLAVAFFAFDGFVRGDSSSAGVSSEPAGETGVDRSIAVLPFADMSEAGDQEWFSDGISEELLNLLAKIPELRVIARTSSFQFKDRSIDLRAIAETLGVAHVLEGSVRRSGDRLRITAQLIDASDGSHLWSESYNRGGEDIFAVQDEIASAVVEELRVTLLGDALDRPVPASTEAYDLFLQGRHLADRRTEEDMNRAIELLTRAIDLDPNFAPAWGQRAAIYANMALAGLLPSDSAGVLQIADVERARALAPDDPLDLSRRAVTMAIVQWNWEEGWAAMSRALEMAPNDMRVAGNASTLAAAYGDLDESLRLALIMIRADPLNPTAHAGLAFAHYVRSEFLEAERGWLTALDLAPTGALTMYRVSNARLLSGDAEGALEAIRPIETEQWGVAALPLIYHALGRAEESDAALAELIERFANINPVAVAEAHAYRGEVDDAFEWLDRAYEEHAYRVAFVKGNPLLANLFDDPRYAALLERLGLDVE